MFFSIRRFSVVVNAPLYTAVLLVLIKPKLITATGRTVATNQSINLVVLQLGVMRVNKLSPLGSSLYYNITVSLLQCDRWALQLLQEIL